MYGYLVTWIVINDCCYRHYFAVYNSTEAGDFLAHIFLNAQFQISDSPYPFSVAPSTSSRKKKRRMRAF